MAKEVQYRSTPRHIEIVPVGAMVVTVEFLGAPRADSAWPEKGPPLCKLDSLFLRFFLNGPLPFRPGEGLRGFGKEFQLNQHVAQPPTPNPILRIAKAGLRIASRV
jgi:hypothetical protein